MGVETGLIFAGLSLFDSFNQAQNAKKTREFQLDQFKSVSRTALQSLNEQKVQSQARTIEERSQVAEELRNFSVTAFNRRGQALASAASGNVSGASIAEIQSDIEQSRGLQTSRLKRLQVFREAAAEARLRAATLQTQSRIEAGLPGGFQEFSVPGALLGAASAGIQGSSLSFPS